MTNLLGQCLGRIEAQVFRLQHDPDACDEHLFAAAVDEEATVLCDLVGSLSDPAVTQRADLDATVRRAVQACLGELGVPIVVRERLAPALPPIACAPAQLAFAVQRALVLATGRLAAGDELEITTRRDGDGVVLELESRGRRRGRERDRHLRERAETLCEFVDGLRGLCRIECDDRDQLLVVIDLPAAMAVDER